jgi:hypothetical protein
MTLHDRDWIALTIKWLLIIGIARTCKGRG